MTFWFNFIEFRYVTLALVYEMHVPEFFFHIGDIWLLSVNFLKQFFDLQGLEFSHWYRNVFTPFIIIMLERHNVKLIELERLWVFGFYRRPCNWILLTRYEKFRRKHNCVLYTLAFGKKMPSIRDIREIKKMLVYIRGDIDIL